MALKTIRIGSMVDIHQYDDAAIDSAIETDAPIKAGAPVALTDVVRKTDLPGVIGGSDTDFTVITAIQAGGAGGVGFQYKTRALTLTSGIIETVGAESGWNDV